MLPGFTKKRLSSYMNAGQPTGQNKFPRLTTISNRIPALSAK
nr:MAG TPA: hypothetical protein [Bacteriophage sp.]